MEELFERATRRAIRFATTYGEISVEDLWGLPLKATNRPNLNQIAVDLHMKLKSGADIDFVDEQSKSDEIIQLKFDVVKHIIDVRVAEKKAREKEQELAEQRQLIMSIIAEKDSAELRSLSKEDLLKRLEGMAGALTKP